MSVGKGAVRGDIALLHSGRVNHCQALVGAAREVTGKVIMVQRLLNVPEGKGQCNAWNEAQVQAY